MKLLAAPCSALMRGVCVLHSFPCPPLQIPSRLFVFVCGSSLLGISMTHCLHASLLMQPRNRHKVSRNALHRREPARARQQLHADSHCHGLFTCNNCVAPTHATLRHVLELPAHRPYPCHANARLGAACASRSGVWTDQQIRSEEITLS